jgi:Calpain family cysteine protease
LVTPIIPKNVDPGIKPISGQEDYGVKKQDVPPPTSSKSLYFSQEKLANRTHYSSHKTPVSNSQWISFHEAIKGEFYDKTFDAEVRKTLFGLERCTDEYDRKKLKYLATLKWKRLSYMYPDCQVIKEGIENRDIYQGALGNCYFLSAISSVSEYPERILRILGQ